MFRIIADSCCDLPENIIEELGVIVAPLTVIFKGDSFPDKNNESLKDMYNSFRKGDLAKTSAVSPYEWEEIVRPCFECGEDVVVLTLSSALSTTYNTACMAKEELSEDFPERNMLVFDSRSASLGEGLLVWFACKKRDEGLSVQDTYKWLEDNYLNIMHEVTADDLMYLKKGGRISASTAILGTALDIKPILHMDNEGYLVNISKCRGRKSAIKLLAKKAAEKIIDKDIAFIGHGDCIEDANYLADLVKEQTGVKKVVVNYLGNVIGAHAGPGTLAVFFYGTER